MSIHSDIDQLRKLIKIEHPPAQVQYETITNNEFFNENTIIVVLEYQKNEIEKIKAELDKLPAPLEFVSCSVKRKWLPDSIKSLFENGDDQTTCRINTHGYKAEKFVKSPFNNGFVLLTETTVFIYLYSI